MSKRIHVSKVGGHTIGGVVLVLGIVAVLWAPAAARAAALTCLTGTDPSVAGDLGQIATVRSAIDSTCVCGNFDGSSGKTHSKYVSCAKSIVAAQVSAGNLRKQCKSTVTKYYSTSTCGFPASQGKQPCVKKTLSNGKVTCAIKPAPKCVGKAGKYEQTPCAAAALCIDASDTNHDGLIGAGDSGACVLSATPTPIHGAPTLTPTPPGPPPLFCGDGTCNNGETCATCSHDCGPCCSGPSTLCSRDAECCAGEICLRDPLNFFPPACCSLNGQACSSWCCSGMCKGGVCCGTTGQFYQCSTDAECCSGLSCVSGRCVVPPQCTARTTCGSCGTGFCVDHCSGHSVLDELCVTSDVGPSCNTDADCAGTGYTACISNGNCAGGGLSTTCRNLCN